MVCLPPIKDAFQLYLRRALHQVACKRAQLSQPTYLVAPVIGIELIGGKLVATMLLKDAKPAAFKRNTCCRCKKSVLAWGYSCARAGVTCPHWILCWSQQIFKDWARPRGQWDALHIVSYMHCRLFSVNDIVSGIKRSLLCIFFMWIFSSLCSVTGALIIFFLLILPTNIAKVRCVISIILLTSRAVYI